ATSIRDAVAQRLTQAVTPKDTTSDRIAINGDFVGDTGHITDIRNLGPAAMIDLPRDGEYAIVQLDASGQVLARQGVIGIRLHVHPDGEDHFHVTGDVPSTFNVSVIKAAGLARIELRRGNTVLASFAPGANAPTVNISSPTGGTFTSGNLPVS